MRYGLVVLWMLLWSVTSAIAQVSIGIGLPGVSIGINLPVFPELVRVPDYPVYYAPRLSSNYFFFDGMYWVYQGDNWYASSWYNGPWGLVAPQAVPLFVLRVPVRYYRAPPAYFRGWRPDTPPRWGEHWGREWEQQRRGWDNWNRKSAPAPAPLPVYQRKYSGDRYPRVEQQPHLQSQNYRYQPRDAVVRQHYQEQALQRAPASSERGQGKALQERSPRQQDTQRASPPSQVQQTAPSSPRGQPPHPIQTSPEQKGQAAQDHRQQPQQGATQRDQQAPRSSQEHIPQGKGASQEPRETKGQEKGQEKGQGKGQGKDREKGEERGQEHK